jgi:hypothetical protein
MQLWRMWVKRIISATKRCSLNEIGNLAVSFMLEFWQKTSKKSNRSYWNAYHENYKYWWLGH